MKTPRVGFGYDVHRFAEGRPLILGGVTIDSPRGLLGHSDADVLCHAIADALLGAAGLPDIGHYFPPGDPSCKDIDSQQILQKVAALLAERGARIGNIDCTLVAEAPKIAPHREAMQTRIAASLTLEPTQIGIKATTNETMGFIGREEGIAAMAVAIICEP